MSGGAFERGRAFEPRPVRAGAPIEHSGWRLKPYTITLPGETLDEGTYERGMRVALGALPAPAAAVRRPGVGFVIRHQGLDPRGGRVHYLVLCWWDNANELFVETFIHGADTGREWVNGQGRGSVCVWDLEVIGHEREAYVRHVLGAGGSDVDAYLADTMAPRR